MSQPISPEALQRRTGAVNSGTVTSDDAAKRIAQTSFLGTALQGVGGFLDEIAVPAAIGAVGASITPQGGVGFARVGATVLNAVPIPVVKVAAIGATAIAAAGGALGFVGRGFSNKANAEQANLDAAQTDKKRLKNYPPNKFEYNLPPHQWSLPVRPEEYDTKNRATKNVKPNNRAVDRDRLIDSYLPTEGVHRYRRGVIWHWDSGGYITQEVETEDGKRAFKTAKQIQKEADKDSKEKRDTKRKKEDYHYGFQFLWNPESISSGISRNMDITPSSADRFRSVAGAFPGQETYQFTILLDRVNDFACLRSLVAKGILPDDPAAPNGRVPNTLRFPDTQIPASVYQYYKYGLGNNPPEKMQRKIKDLMKFGTMADLEYLFKCLNGKGSFKGQTQGWTTLLNKPTSNIGFLAPTLIACRLGPDATQSLSFVGWITNLSINHSFFTEDMIPLRTTVSFNCDAFAGSTVV